MHDIQGWNALPNFSLVSTSKHSFICYYQTQASST
jgi:hypothetical protein